MEPYFDSALSFGRDILDDSTDDQKSKDNDVRIDKLAAALSAQKKRLDALGNMKMRTETPDEMIGSLKHAINHLIEETNWDIVPAGPDSMMTYIECKARLMEARAKCQKILNMMNGEE